MIILSETNSPYPLLAETFRLAEGESEEYGIWKQEKYFRILLKSTYFAEMHGRQQHKCPIAI